MSKILTKKNMTKLIIIIVIILLFNAIFPVYSHADVVGDIMENIGGIIFDPIQYLLAFFSDSILYLIQWSLTGVAIPPASERAKPTNADEWQVDVFGEIAWPTIVVSPEEIFSNNLPALNANFFTSIPEVNNSDNSKYFSELNRNPSEGEEEVFINHSYSESLVELRKTISSWYVSFRNLAAAALLSVLIYVAIRMIISSVAEDKAKYKSMIMNWLVAVAIVFFLHFAMSFIMWISEEFVDILRSVSIDNGSYDIVIEDTKQSFTLTKDFTLGSLVSVDHPGDAKIYNLMELVRVYMSAKNTLISFPYLIIYIALIGFTCMFTWKYLMRFINLAFLTLLAPLIAITYPMDKLKDGNAQAFSFWLKEYTMNAMLPVIHMLIYVVLVGSAVELAQTNFIYTFAVFMFMLKAEDIIKNMFGLSGGSSDNNGSFAGGALAASAMSKAKGAIGGAAKSGGKDSIRTSDNKGLSESSSPDTVGINDAYGNDTGSDSSNSDNTQFMTTDEIAEKNKEEANKKASNDRIDKAAQGTESLSGGYTDANGDKQNYTRKEKRKIKRARKLNAKAATEKKILDGAKSVEKIEDLRNKGLDNQKFNRKEIRGIKKLRKANKPVGKFTAARRALGIKKPSASTVKKSFKSVGRGVRKAAIMGAATAAVGAVSLGVAMGTGNAKILGAGLGVGMLAGRKLDSGMMKVGSSVKNNYREEIYDIEKAEQMKNYDEFKNNPENLKYFKKEFGNNGKPLSDKEAKAKMEEARSFIESGYSNPKDIKKLMKIKEKTKGMNDNKGLTDKQIMSAEQSARNDYAKKDIMDVKKSKEIENGIYEQMKASGISKNDKDLKQFANNHMNAIRSAHGLAHKK